MHGMIVTLGSPRLHATSRLTALVSLDSNKQVVRRFYAEAINGRELGAVDRLLSEDFSHNGERRGRDGQRQAVDAFLRGFPDLHTG